MRVQDLPIAEPSFADFYRERWSWAVRLAYVLAGSRPMAEDVAQDAFAKLYERFDAVTDRTAYLRVSIVNGTHSNHRSANRFQRTVHLLADRTRSSGAPRELLDAVDRIPYREKAVLVMRYYEDLPDDAIAAVVGCRPATVRTAAARALRRLRRELPS